MDGDLRLTSNIKICPICGREIPGDSESDHHLIPKEITLSKRNKKKFDRKATITIHLVCHKKIHSMFSNKELAREYNTAEKIATHEGIKSFSEWISKKPLEFDTYNKASR